jgi:hypothetical protein
MEYLLVLLGGIFLIILQCILIILKLTGEFVIGWGLALLPCWFVCGFFLLALAFWIFTLLM